MKRLLAVLGQAVQTSLSPRLHTAAATACGIDVAYVPIVCRDEAHFLRVVEALQTVGARGANVTMPYKRVAADRCQTLSSTAAQMGAVNTLTFDADGGLRGTNTDGPALVRLFGAMPRGTLDRVQLLGAGGAARAVLWALRAVGASETFVCARRDVSDMVDGFGARAGPMSPIPSVTLVISALPGTAALAETALDQWVDTAATPRVYDLAYGGGAPSPLVARARARGLVAADGLGMLVEQAALALSEWTGQDVDALRRAMKRSVDRPEGDDPFDSDSGRD